MEGEFEMDLQGPFDTDKPEYAILKNNSVDGEMQIRQAIADRVGLVLQNLLDSSKQEIELLDLDEEGMVDEETERFRTNLLSMLDELRSRSYKLDLDITQSEKGYDILVNLKGESVELFRKFVRVMGIAREVDSVKRSSRIALNNLGVTIRKSQELIEPLEADQNLSKAGEARLAQYQDTLADRTQKEEAKSTKHDELLAKARAYFTAESHDLNEMSEAAESLLEYLKENGFIDKDSALNEKWEEALSMQLELKKYVEPEPAEWTPPPTVRKLNKIMNAIIIALVLSLPITYGISHLIQRGNGKKTPSALKAPEAPVPKSYPDDPEINALLKEFNIRNAEHRRNVAAFKRFTLSPNYNKAKATKFLDLMDANVKKMRALNLKIEARAKVIKQSKHNHEIQVIKPNFEKHFKKIPIHAKYKPTRKAYFDMVSNIIREILSYQNPWKLKDLNSNKGVFSHGHKHPTRGIVTSQVFMQSYKERNLGLETRIKNPTLQGKPVDIMKVEVTCLFEVVVSGAINGREMRTLTFQGLRYIPRKD
ncbi:hypothetical protein ACFL3T_01380 [Patescibacteria group bacterium]